MDVKKLLRRADELKSERSTLDSYWQELADYCLPRKAYITRDRIVGDKLDMTQIYDATAIFAVQLFSAGLHGYLTNPASKWFVLRMEDEKLMDGTGVKEWLKDTENKVYDTLNGSNFAQMVHEVYIDLGVFGTGTLYEEEDPASDVRFYALPVNEIYVVEDAQGRVNEIYRRFKLSARQIVDKWGADNAGEKVNKAIEKDKPGEMFEILHAVGPRYARDVAKKDSVNMPWYSCYVEVSGKHIINESGYDEFPYFEPRYGKVSGYAYGYSPCMIAFSDIKMVNAMSKTVLKAAQKIVDPPLLFPSDSYIMPIITKPGGLNFKKKGAMTNERVEPLMTNANIPIGLEMVNQIRTQIKQALHVDLFLTLADKSNMTATEVVQRVEEKMLLLGPSLGRIMEELLKPVITRTVNILARKGKLKPPPEALMAKDEADAKRKSYAIEYVSPLAKAQRISEVNSLNNVLMIATQLAQVSPDILDKIDFDATFDYLADINNIDPNLTRDSEEVKPIREAKQKAQEAQMAMAMAEQGAGAVKNIAGAAKDIVPAQKPMGGKQ